MSETLGHAPTATQLSHSANVTSILPTAKVAGPPLLSGVQF